MEHFPGKLMIKADDLSRLRAADSARGARLHEAGAPLIFYGARVSA
jgi:hypothetical protein